MPSEPRHIARLDPRWDWVELVTFGGESRWVKGQCRHVDVVPVESADAVVAHLCLTCDGQLPEEWPIELRRGR